LSQEYETTIPEPRNYLDGVHESLEPEPAPDPEPFGSNHTEIERAAEELSSSRAERNQVVERQFHDGQDFTKVAPGNKTVSPEYAADKLKEIRELEQQVEGWDRDAALQKEIDALRAGDAQQPTVQPQPAELQPQAEYAPPAEPSELDVLLAPLPPEQRQHFVSTFNQMVDSARHQNAQQYEAAVQQVYGVQQQYEAAVAQTLLAAEASALAPFPELHGIPRDQVQAVVQHIARTDPEKYRRISWHVQTVKELAANQLQVAQTALQQQQAAQQQQRAQAAQQFQQWAAAEDSKVDKLLAAETPERRLAITQEAAAILREDGLTDAQIQYMWQNDTTFRSAPAQKMLMREAKARLAERGIRAARVAPVPHVVRPGVSEGAVDRSAYADLERQFRGQPLTPKQAAQLVIARRAR
jgi:hypothetical protein